MKEKVDQLRKDEIRLSRGLHQLKGLVKEQDRRIVECNELILTLSMRIDKIEKNMNKNIFLRMFK